MEGRLIHHAMEWLSTERQRIGSIPSCEALREQLGLHYRVLYARGVRTAFTSKNDTLERVLHNIYPDGTLHPIVASAIEGAQHVEYEIRTVRKVVESDLAGKTKLLLTGVLDLVVQQQSPLTYHRSWKWTDLKSLTGETQEVSVAASEGEWEIWDYKGSREDNNFLTDYVRQLVSYAKLFEERTGQLPARCVLFFVNEKTQERRLLAIPITQQIADAGLAWTIKEAKALRMTELRFQDDPKAVQGGSTAASGLQKGTRITPELRVQCTTCGQRFDCEEYEAYLGGDDHNDIRRDNVFKN
jgi:hypothetical protein